MNANRQRVAVPMVAALLSVPVAAVAAETQAAGGGLGFFGVFVQMIASLALVLGVILLFYYVSNRWLKVGSPIRAGERHIRLVETRYLAPKKSLVLVEVGGEYLLLANSGESLNFVKQIDILEEIEVLDEEERQGRRSPFQGKLDDLLARLPKSRKSRPARFNFQAGRS